MSTTYNSNAARLLALLLLSPTMANEAWSQDWTPVSGPFPDPPAWPAPSVAATAPATAAPFRTETTTELEDFVEAESVEMLVARAQIDLSEAGQSEQLARESYNLFKSMGVQPGAGTPTNNLGRAKALSSYVEHLVAADATYVDVIERLAGTAGTTEATRDPALDEAERQLSVMQTDHSLSNASCFADPESCVAPNADHEALMEEIAGLVAILEGQAGRASLNPADVLRTAELLHTRATLAIRIARLMGHQLVLEATVQRGPDGKPLPLPVPTPSGPAKAKTAYVPRSPYSNKGGTQQ